MRAWAKGFGSISIVGAFLLFPMDSGAESLGAMRVSLLQGDVQVKIAEMEEWAPASVNMSLVEGDELWVPEGSHAAIQTNNGSHVRLGANTALQVLQTDSGSFQFHLAQGDVYVQNRAPKHSTLQFDTPDASIRSFGNSTYRIEVPEGETDVSVFRGSVLTEGADGTTQVRRGEMLVLGADGSAELSPVPPPDEWHRWNLQQDRAVLARGGSHRYLPVELRVYSSDFDESGRWVNVPEYGYCWTPTVVVTSDWAPYRHGRWVWRGGDYVWVGYEPWGWAPYHYGRWAFAINIGWLWVPPARGDVFWAPGYVGWVRTGDHVAWVPLAPREVYYGRGNYGRYSTNITNVTTNQVHVTNVYRNVNVNNSVTVVNQTTFVTGRPSSIDRNVAVNVREDFAKRRNIVVGSPRIQPTRTSYIPVDRTIPETKRPPAAVRKIDVKELKKSRPLVKEPDRSAIRPQSQPHPLEVKKVEKPRTVSERAREREQVASAQRGRPQQTAPQEKARPQVAPDEKERPKEARAEKGKLKETPAERGKPQQTAPHEKAKPQVAPDERGRPQEARAEKGNLKEASTERGKPQQTAPHGKVKPQVAPDERGKPQEARAEKGNLKEASTERGKPKSSSSEKDKSKEASPGNGSLENPRSGTEKEGEKGRR